MKTNFNFNSWEISQGDYNSISDNEEAFEMARKKEKIFNNIMLFLYFLGGTVIIFFASLLVGKI